MVLSVQSIPLALGSECIIWCGTSQCNAIYNHQPWDSRQLVGVATHHLRDNQPGGVAIITHSFPLQLCVGLINQDESVACILGNQAENVAHILGSIHSVLRDKLKSPPPPPRGGGTRPSTCGKVSCLCVHIGTGTKYI